MRSRYGKRQVALERALSKLGLLSRSAARRAILDGRIAVDGRVVADPLAAVEPERARVTLDGAPLTPPAKRTLMFHKPRGVITTLSDPDGRRTVLDVAGESARGLVPVGRLDWASTGLLLLTNDTRLVDRLTDPANAVERSYRVTARGLVTAEETARLAAGVWADGELLRAHQVEVHKASRRESHLRVVLTEGKNREIRRLFAALGHEVTRLHRFALGRLALGDLGVGACRELGQDEVRAAFESSTEPVPED